MIFISDEAKEHWDELPEDLKILFGDPNDYHRPAGSIHFLVKSEIERKPKQNRYDRMMARQRAKARK